MGLGDLVLGALHFTKEQKQHRKEQKDFEKNMKQWFANDKNVPKEALKLAIKRHRAQQEAKKEERKNAEHRKQIAFVPASAHKVVLDPTPIGSTLRPGDIEYPRQTATVINFDEDDQSASAPVIAPSRERKAKVRPTKSADALIAIKPGEVGGHAKSADAIVPLKTADANDSPKSNEATSSPKSNEASDKTNSNDANGCISVCDKKVRCFVDEQFDLRKILDACLLEADKSVAIPGFTGEAKDSSSPAQQAKTPVELHPPQPLQLPQPPQCSKDTTATAQQQDNSQSKDSSETASPKQRSIETTPPSPSPNRPKINAEAKRNMHKNYIYTSPYPSDITPGTLRKPKAPKTVTFAPYEDKAYKRDKPDKPNKKAKVKKTD